MIYYKLIYFKNIVIYNNNINNKIKCHQQL